jgi:hypothetical protein
LDKKPKKALQPQHDKQRKNILDNKRFHGFFANRLHQRKFHKLQDEINALNDLANVKEQPDLKFESTFIIFQHFIIFSLNQKKGKIGKDNSFKKSSYNF